MVMFYLDYQWSDIDNIQFWGDQKLLSTLFIMKPFKAYFLMDIDDILCSKYEDN